MNLIRMAHSLQRARRRIPYRERRCQRKFELTALTFRSTGLLLGPGVMTRVPILCENRGSQRWDGKQWAGAARRLHRSCKIPETMLQRLTRHYQQLKNVSQCPFRSELQRGLPASKGCRTRPHDRSGPTHLSGFEASAVNCCFIACSVMTVCRYSLPLFSMTTQVFPLCAEM